MEHTDWLCSSRGQIGDVYTVKISCGIRIWRALQEHVKWSCKGDASNSIHVFQGPGAWKQRRRFFELLSVMDAQVG
jgi:hypothetical protein